MSNDNGTPKEPRQPAGGFPETHCPTVEDEKASTNDKSSKETPKDE